MIGKYKKIISRYFSKSRIVSTVCLILIFFFSVNLTKEIVNRHQIDRKIRQYEEQTAKLEKENKEISVLIDAWQNGRQLEKEARLKLGLKKPGENVVLISRNNGQAGEEKIMASMKYREISKMSKAEKESKIKELKIEMIKSSANAQKAAKAKEIKRMIAKIIASNKQ